MEAHMRMAEHTEVDPLSGLGPLEREIASMVIERLQDGEETYGPWPTDDNRLYPQEALEEVLDGMTYLAAELLRLQREREREVEREGGRSRMPRVYVCHPFSHDEDAARQCVRRISRGLLLEGAMPIAPHLYLPNFLDESSEREIALGLCKELIRGSDQVRVYGTLISPGMRAEIAFANQLGVPVLYTSARAEIP
jgi:hypothetical protein